MDPRRKPFGATRGDPAKNLSTAVTSGASFSLQRRHALLANIQPSIVTPGAADYCTASVQQLQILHAQQAEEK